MCAHVSPLWTYIWVSLLTKEARDSHRGTAEVNLTPYNFIRLGRLSGGSEGFKSLWIVCCYFYSAANLSSNMSWSHLNSGFEKFLNFVRTWNFVWVVKQLMSASGSLVRNHIVQAARPTRPTSHPHESRD